MKLASWNVNSINVRLPHLLQWLAEAQPDLVGLQELKTTNEKFPFAELQQAGYSAIAHGQKTYNGVAILSRLSQSPVDVHTQLPGMSDDPQCRLIAASYGELRFIDVYVPNGSEVGSEKYLYKLAWLDAFIVYIKESLQRYPKLIIVGDFNIAPEDRDVHDPKTWEGSVLVSPQERERFRKLLELGLHDSFRLFTQEAGHFSWWDYRAAAFVRNLGLRIDHVLISTALTSHCTGSHIDKTPRQWDRPSDHTPVISEFSQI